MAVIKNRFAQIVGAFALVSLTVSCAGQGTHDDVEFGRDWFTYGGDDNQLHYSPLDQINAGNVGKLSLAWYHDIDAHDAYTTPLEIGGVLYYAAGMSVLTALDATTGKELWTFDPDVASQPEAKVAVRAGWAVRGIGYARGKVFVATREGRLIAVDAKTGKQVWSVQTLDQAPNGYITGVPYVAGDNVIIGFGGADYDTTRGYVTAYNIDTGKKAWRFFTVPGNPADGFEDKAMEMAAKTWTGEWWKYGGGGTVWHAMAYDPKYDRVYLGTGNGFPWNHKIRSPEGGDNLFLASIVALDAKTGEYIWHYQTNPGVTWDFNDAMDIELTQLTIDGKQHDVLLHAPKNGFYYVIDRKDGKLLSAEKFGPVNWADKIDMDTGRPVENPAARYPDGKPFLLYPFPYGAHGVQAMSHSPKTGLTYIPVMEGGRWHIDPPNIKDFKVKHGMMVNTGLGAIPADLPPPPPGIGKLVAWDPVAGKEVWSQPEPDMFGGGVLSTAGNLVFQGQVSGEVVAYTADKGEKVWAFDAQNGVLGSPISYSVNGKQYVTVIASFRSSYPSNPIWPYRQQQRRVLTFTLDGKASLPPFTKVPVEVVDDPAFVIDAAKAEIGAGVYNQSCIICHGPGIVAGGAAPDLRASSVPLDADVFRQVVHDGMLMSRGMGAFGNLSDEQLEGLRHYIRQRARATKDAK
ncbi:alcohol dehydrogenase [Croceicoccus estronivorus]|uniref:PQQ-dependent dehydrogenase, methanol/ethanol family n=1 Tax=Croceicoccus estronivorus TaxID=1172626 RepID=UPI00082CD182|nr:PQQ-dependent dehydrogenase, methanol/ethanol family [Croceicoccus estronivorus]OCC23520.1 alcohol dehydrogenase [Croceicoccus estronivorus]